MCDRVRSLSGDRRPPTRNAVSRPALVGRRRKSAGMFSAVTWDFHDMGYRAGTRGSCAFRTANARLTDPYRGTLRETREVRPFFVGPDETLLGSVAVGRKVPRRKGRPSRCQCCRPEPRSTAAKSNGASLTPTRGFALLFPSPPHRARQDAPRFSRCRPHFRVEHLHAGSGA
jgi:hypothetical protein